MDSPDHEVQSEDGEIEQKNKSPSRSRSRPRSASRCCESPSSSRSRSPSHKSVSPSPAKKRRAKSVSPEDRSGNKKRKGLHVKSTTTTSHRLSSVPVDSFSTTSQCGGSATNTEDYGGAAHYQGQNKPFYYDREGNHNYGGNFNSSNDYNGYQQGYGGNYPKDYYCAGNNHNGRGNNNRVHRGRSPYRRSERGPRRDSRGRRSACRTWDSGKRIGGRKWEEAWPPTEIFKLIEEEITKYSRRQDKSALRNLFDKMESLDRKLKKVKSGDDLKDTFGRSEAARLMVFYIATNGTLRARVNDLKSRFGTDEPDVRKMDVL